MSQGSVNIPEGQNATGLPVDEWEFARGVERRSKGRKVPRASPWVSWCIGISMI